MKTAVYAPLLVAFLPFAPSTQPAPRDVGVAPAAREDEHEVDPRDIVQHAKLSLRDAIQRALAAQPGRAVEADLEGEADDGEVEVFFEVMVLGDDGELHEVRLDPANGEVRSNEEAEEDEDEIPGFRTALRHSELDLAGLVAKAESYVKGTPVSASLEFEDGSPRCDVAFVNTRFIIEVEVEGRAGHLVEIELRQDGEDEESQGRSEEDEENGEGSEENGEEGEEGSAEAEEMEESGERAEGGKRGEEAEEEEGAEHGRRGESAERGKLVR